MSNKPPSTPLPTSPRGMKAVSEEDFREMYEWQLEEYANDSKKIITLIPLKDYFDIGLCCIRHELTISAFIREAIMDRKDDIPKISKKLKGMAKNKEHEKQGRLF